VKVVGHDEWLHARKELLKREKEFTRMRDELTSERQSLPWEAVEKEYVFQGPRGEETLADLFAGRSQLVVYHFMFGPEDEVGCKSCSFWADNFNPNVVHLNARDVSFAAVSRAPFEKLAAYRERMDWGFHWVSSAETDTYSAYARGIDLLNTAYNYLDIVPKGRDEGGRSQYWVRRHDEY